MDSNRTLENKLNDVAKNNKDMSRRKFIDRTGKAIVLGTVAHFALIGIPYRAQGATGDHDDCGGDPNHPLYVPQLPCDGNDNTPPCSECDGDASCGFLSYTLPCLVLPAYWDTEP